MSHSCTEVSCMTYENIGCLDLDCMSPEWCQACNREQICSYIDLVYAQFSPTVKVQVNLPGVDSQTSLIPRLHFVCAVQWTAILGPCVVLWTVWGVLLWQHWSYLGYTDGHNSPCAALLWSYNWKVTNFLYHVASYTFLYRDPNNKPEPTRPWDTDTIYQVFSEIFLTIIHTQWSEFHY